MFSIALQFICLILTVYIQQNEAEKQYRRLNFLKSKEQSRQSFKREGFLGLLGPKVPLLNHHEKKLEDLQDNVRKEKYSLAGKVSASVG